MMMTKPKISLCVPHNQGRYFSFRIKKELTTEKSEYNAPSKLVVISDIEGNFKSFVKVLVRSKVVDKNLQWSFDDGHLVIVGDCFDRGEQVTECLWLLYSLEEKARNAGGYVHFILGNHEIMNLNGDWRYVHPKYAKKSESSTSSTAALYGGNNELWRWLCTKNIIERVGDILFVHGGISCELLKLGLAIPEINNLARSYYNKVNETFENISLFTILSSENSPLWYRGYYQHNIDESQIDLTLTYFKVKTIVTGHTIVDKVASFFNGKVINVDTDHASGNSEALLIKNDYFYRIDRHGKRERIK